jgi:hypothetical protein
MRRSKKSREMDERVARLDAEYRAGSYLDNFPAELAAVVAFRVAWFLATSWEYKQREMLQQGTAGNTIHISDADLQVLQAMLAMIQPGTPSDAVAEQHVIALLVDFPPDEASWVAHKVAKCAAFRLRLSRHQPLPPAAVTMAHPKN